MKEKQEHTDVRQRRMLAQEFVRLFEKDDDVSVLIKPDPDSIASALAVKRLLWRRVQNASIVHVGEIQRLDNAAMLDLLDIDMTEIGRVHSEAATRRVLVDAQPDHSELFSNLTFDAIIDHHPVKHQWDVAFVDIRPDYGATASIMLEYLRAACIRPSEKLATALLFAIKTDTANFRRSGGEEDVRQFQYVFNHANRQLLNKIERTDLMPDDLRYFQMALSNHIVMKEALYTHLGKLKRSDICVQVADFLTRVHGIGWVFVSGVYEDKLIVIFRNDGYRKNAEKRATKAFSDVGLAGGHKGAARAEIPLDALRKKGVRMYSTDLVEFVRARLKI